MGTKIALCIGGYWKSFTDPCASGLEGFRHLKEVLFDKYENVDVFIHSWDLPKEKEINQIYGYWIKKQKFEKQINFSTILKDKGISDDRFSSELGYNRNFPWDRILDGEMKTKFPNYLSQAFTRSESLKLKKQYEESRGFKYDWVIQTRFDVFSVNRRITDHNKPDVSRIKFSPEQDNTKIYFPFWHDFNEGMPDIWFYSDSENMNKLIDFEKKIMTWFAGKGNFLNSMKNGFFDSNRDNPWSNEILLPLKEKSANLKTYNEREMINYSVFMKQLLKEQGLYDKVKILERISYV